MRLQSIGGSRLMPEPSMPPGLVELMEDLTRNVLRHNPADLYEYCANHMAKLIEIRDGKGPIPKLTLEQKIARAQKKMRKKAEERRKKYDMEMELLKNKMKSAEEEQNNQEEVDNKSESETLFKAIHHDGEIIHLSELEIAHENNENVINTTDDGDKNKISEVESNLKDLQKNESEKLKKYESEPKAVAEMVISKTSSKSEESVPHGYDTIDSATTINTSDVNQETATDSAKDNQENNKTGENKQLLISAKKSIETSNYEIKEYKYTADESGNEINKTNNEEVNVTTENVSTEKENSVIENSEQSDTDVSTIANQDNVNREKADPGLKSECINESNKIAHTILDDVVHASEACVNEIVKSKESNIDENIVEKINKDDNLRDAKDKEKSVSKIYNFSIEFKDLVENAVNDKTTVSEDFVDKDKNVAVVPNEQEIVVNDSNDVVEMKEDSKLDISTNNDADIKLELQQQNLPTEIPAEKIAAYVCGESEVKPVGEKNTSSVEKEGSNAKDSHIDKVAIIEESEKTVPYAFSTETADTQSKDTITVNKESNETISNSEENNSGIKSVENHSGPINVTETAKESNESESTVNLHQNCIETKDTNDVEGQDEESKEVISRTDSSDGKITNIAENIATKILGDSQQSHGVITIKDDLGKVESLSDKVLNQNMDKPEDLSNYHLLNHSMDETKLTESMFSSEANISKSDSDENKINPGEEKGNDNDLSVVDPVTECETIELNIVENGHRDNDAPIEIPQDDTSTTESSPEHERTKRTEDEISDIQEISNISDLQQLHTIEINSIGKRSSIGDSTIDENSDSNGESDTIKESNDLSQSPSGMDLETAAVTIQKVFRSFMFKSRCSTFDDTGNDDNHSVDDDREDIEYEVTSNKDRRPLGISRMDTVTVLQTVNEEKSLSLSTDDSSLSSAATIIQAHVRGFLVRNRLNSSKASSTSLVNSDGQPGQSFETDGEQQTNKTILNIQLVPEGGHYLSRDESVLTSVDLSLDGSPPSSINLHPLGYDKSEPRKQLKREDAIQSISPPSNNSGKLSEEVDSLKEALSNESEQQTSEEQVREEKVDEGEDKLDDYSCETTPSKSTTVETVIEVKKFDKNSVESCQENIENEKKVKDNHLVEISSDEADVISPFIANGSYSSDSDNTSGLIHSGEFHDIVLPTKVSRKTSVVRGE